VFKKNIGFIEKFKNRYHYKGETITGI